VTGDAAGAGVVEAPGSGNPLPLLSGMGVVPIGGNWLPPCCGMPVPVPKLPEHAAKATMSAMQRKRFMLLSQP
jgi:hypothetical protein